MWNNSTDHSVAARDAQILQILFLTRSERVIFGFKRSVEKSDDLKIA